MLQDWGEIYNILKVRKNYYYCYQLISPLCDSNYYYVYYNSSGIERLGTKFETYYLKQAETLLGNTFKKLKKDLLQVSDGWLLLLLLLYNWGYMIAVYSIDR